MRGDRQRFCPACSGAASSQRPLTGSDTSLCCRPECVCVSVGASPALLQPGLASALYDFLYFLFFFSGPTSQHLFRISSPARHVYLVSERLVSLGSWKHICVCGEGFKWEAERKRMMCWAAVSRTGSLPAGVWPWPAVSVRSRSRSAEGKPREGNK